MTAGDRVRPLEKQDLPELVRLCREHADFERAAWSEHEREASLEALLIASDSAWCWVVEVAGQLAGFASACLELSTWDARRYLHLDCLYLRADYRDQGWGRGLIERVAATALEQGAVNLQWQTPIWNDGAARFYDRLGARSAEKLRFTLDRDACTRLLADDEGGSG